MLPCSTMLWRHVTIQFEGRAKQSAVRMRCGDLVSVPPEIHEHIEGFEGLHSVPPKVGDVDRIARTQFGPLRHGQSFTEARIALKVGLVVRDQADRKTGRRDVERTDVEIADLVRWERREAASAGNHKGEVVRGVKVRRDGRCVPYPKVRQV